MARAYLLGLALLIYSLTVSCDEDAHSDRTSGSADDSPNSNGESVGTNEHEENWSFDDTDISWSEISVIGLVMGASIIVAIVVALTVCCCKKYAHTSAPPRTPANQHAETNDPIDMKIDGIKFLTPQHFGTTRPGTPIPRYSSNRSS
ncbi:uncharacterized protein [Watersipora subatra]|uniref:uncharacterized protein isoform X2 n=1 Tax=Watersipora subatra TaxID=2589382 RepID=UPI00355C1971